MASAIPTWKTDRAAGKNREEVRVMLRILGTRWSLMGECRTAGGASVGRGGPPLGSAEAGREGARSSEFGVYFSY
jgi:hypothetical protein